LHAPSFWIITLASAAFSFHYSSLLLFIIPHLQESGFSRELAATATLMLYAIGMPGRIFFGWLADRMDVKKLYSACFLFAGLGLFLLTQVTQFWHMVPFAFVYGWAQGCNIAVQNVMMAELFGRRHFATIRGMTQPISVGSGVLGPLFAGFIFDMTGLFDTAFYIFGAIMILPAPALLFLKKIVVEDELEMEPTQAPASSQLP
jgi:MFS family permease